MVIVVTQCSLEFSSGHVTGARALRQLQGDHGHVLYEHRASRVVPAEVWHHRQPPVRALPPRGPLPTLR